MKLRVLYFASLRERLGLAQEDLDLPVPLPTVGTLRDHLVARGGAWAEAFGPARPVRAALDQAMATPDTALRDGAEVAFFPPVTGG